MPVLPNGQGTALEAVHIRVRLSSPVRNCNNMVRGCVRFGPKGAGQLPALVILVALTKCPLGVTAAALDSKPSLRNGV